MITDYMLVTSDILLIGRRGAYILQDAGNDAVTMIDVDTGRRETITRHALSIYVQHTPGATIQPPLPWEAYDEYASRAHKIGIIAR